MTAVTLTVHGNLLDLLPGKLRTGAPFTHLFERRASIKDVIESLGIPHPVIGSLTVNGSGVDFHYILQHEDRVEVFPLASPVNPLVPTLLRPDPLQEIAFIVDVNVGKLALLLRMFGFDTLYDSTIKNGRLAEIGASSGRILLTRDTTLLRRKIIMHGYLVREQYPERQLIEIIRLYDLMEKIAPLTRCIPCNGLLVPVSKENVMDRLEPLTRKYYDRFHACSECGKIYWPGSHQERINTFIREISEAVCRN